MTKKVILIRGVSGSGKSTHVKELVADMAKNGLLVQEVVVCSADDYFMVHVAPGVTEYRFNPSELPRNHSRCFSKYLEALYDQAVKVVIVDNTFIHQWLMQNYIKLANLLECDLEIHELRLKTIDDLSMCAQRNVHRVPADIVARMAYEFEPMEIGPVKVFPVK